MTFPVDEKYEIAFIEGLSSDPDKQLKILRNIKCSGTVKHYTQKILIENVGPTGNSVIIDQTEAFDAVASKFKIPSVSGQISKARNKMFAIPYEVPDGDLFGPFERLEQFLTKFTFAAVSGDTMEQRRLVSWLMTDFSEWK